MKRTIPLLFPILLLALLVACLGAYRQAQDAAERAILQARGVNAHHCAGEIYDRAEKLLAQSRQSVQQRRYDDAQTQAQAARQLAEQAYAAAKNRPDCILAKVADQPTTASTARGGNAVPAPAGSAAFSQSPSDDGAGKALAQRGPGTAVLPGGEELEMIHFEFDSDLLTGAARAILDQNAGKLKRYPQIKIIVEGHCDERGSTEYNLALGQRRAQQARDYLVTQGVAAESLSLISYGEEHPLDPAASEEAFAKNRRAQFTLGVAQ